METEMATKISSIDTKSFYGHDSVTETQSLVTIPSYYYDDSENEGGEEEEEEEVKKYVVKFGYITEKHLQQISYELGLIKLCWPSITAFDIESIDLYPESYKRNTAKEKVLIFYGQNFQRQYSYKHKTRRPLLLAVENECGLQKFVSTTIIPTKLTYPEFDTWEGCAAFISDHIKYEEISDEKATFLPERLLSPETIMRTQKGNCFEMATLLASFLIGSGYNAYVVSGYATQEICSNDLTRTQCPLIIEKIPVPEPPPPPKVSKYVARPKRDLRSKFLLMMAEREEALIREEQERLAEEERLRILEMEKPDPDPLYGWRVHSWVLMLPGKQDVNEVFFIEPASGTRYEISDPNYLGIESIWNNSNYWVNIQICENGCQDLNFDLQNPSYWEHLLAGEPWDQRVVAKDNFSFPEAKDFTLQEKHLDMPFSWVSPIELPHNKYTERYPNASKMITYRKTRCDLFAPYFHRDGLVWRVITYKDYESFFPETVTESYMFREDCLVKKIKYIQSDLTIEYYRSGRDDAMKVFKAAKIDETVHILREIDFYSEARYDGMKRLEMGPEHIMELFQGRVDRLLSRYCKAVLESSGATRHKVLSVTEKYARNPEIPADDDIETIEFRIEANEIIIKYHYADDRITAATTRIVRPPFYESSGILSFNPDLFSIYKPDPMAKEDRKIKLYNLMINCLECQDLTLQHIRGMEDEIFSMVRTRAMESAQAHLLVSMFDEERNEEAKKGMKELELAMKERSNREVETEVDFLAPYLVSYKDKKLTPDKAMLIKERCLSDYKECLVSRANRIRIMFEKTASQLAEQQKIHESWGEKITREKEEAYLKNIKRLLFLLNTLEIRLERHKEMAPKRYEALVECLEYDPRLITIFK